MRLSISELPVEIGATGRMLSSLNVEGPDSIAALVVVAVMIGASLSDLASEVHAGRDAVRCREHSRARGSRHGRLGQHDRHGDDLAGVPDAGVHGVRTDLRDVPLFSACYQWRVGEPFENVLGEWVSNVVVPGY